ncbi:MAG: hypothetical protein V4695_04115 [Pseudomonadota bacterium]
MTMVLSATALLDKVRRHVKNNKENADEKKRGLAALFPDAMMKKVSTSVAYKPLYW